MSAGAGRWRLLSLIPRSVQVTLLAVGLLVCGPVAADAPAILVAVGDVTDTSAIVWFRAPRAGPVLLELFPSDGSASGVTPLTVTADRDFTAKVALRGLAPGSRYTYRVRQSFEAVDGEFATAPAGDVPARVTFLWSGDLGSAQHCRHVNDGYPIFSEMARRRADFFLFVGDTIYADGACGGPDRAPGYDFVATTLAGYHAKHRYNREDPAAHTFYRGTPVYAIWDDHDVRNDFVGPEERLMPIGRQAFVDYWPLEPPAEEPARLYRRFRWGKLVEVFILDTRQYRSANRERDGPDKTMLGATQRRWLVDGVASSTAVWKVIVTSVTLSVPGRPTARDGWSNASVFGLPDPAGTGFSFERDRILRELRARHARNLLFVAADVHHAEVIVHRPAAGSRIHELIAGPMSAFHGFPRPLDEALHPRSLFSATDVNNFGEVTIEAAGATVRIFAEDGRELFSHSIRPE